MTRPSPPPRWRPAWLSPCALLLGLGAGSLAGCDSLFSSDPFAGCKSIPDPAGKHTYLCQGTIVSVEDLASVAPKVALEAHLAKFLARSIPGLRIQRSEREIQGKSCPAAELSASPAANTLGVRAEVVAVPLPAGGTRLVACGGAALASERLSCGSRMAVLITRGPASARTAKPAAPPPAAPAAPAAAPPPAADAAPSAAGDAR